MSLLTLWDIDGQEIDLNSFGLTGLKLTIPSPSFQVTKDAIPGRSGSITLGKDLLPRDLVAEFLVSSSDYEDSLLLRDELYSLFSKGSLFYIGEKKQPGKRWFVECTDQWVPERVNQNSLVIKIPLTAESGLAESVLTTLNPSLFQGQLTGQGYREIKYKHSSNTFSIYNGGNVVIDPRYLPLKISYKGSSSNLKITNLSTSEEWSYSGTSNSGDITLDGIRSTKNGLSVFRYTNKKLITLNPGWNSFELVGTSGSFEIQFDFRFYYL